MARGDRDPNALLVEKHLDFVRLIAKDEVSRWGPRLSLEDAVQYGVEGLLVADQRFDSAAGVEFRTYAERIVSGHIRDGAAKMLDGRRRRTPRHAVPYDEHAENVAALNSQHSRYTQDLEAWEVDFRRTDVDVRALYEGWCTLEDAAEAGGVLLAHVQRALPALPPVERRIIEHHFFEGRPFQELTVELGLSKASISRRYSKAIVRLRKLTSARSAPR